MNNEVQLSALQGVQDALDNLQCVLEGEMSNFTGTNCESYVLRALFTKIQSKCESILTYKEVIANVITEFDDNRSAIEKETEFLTSKGLI